jgi:hypothetical protein
MGGPIGYTNAVDITEKGYTGDDHPFFVLPETNFSIRCIPVWARYSPLRTRVEAHAIISHQDPTGALVIHLLLGRTRWSIRTPTVNPSQCTFVQMTDTDVAFLLYYRSCPYDCHDLYLPSILASLKFAVLYAIRSICFVCA